MKSDRDKIDIESFKTLLLRRREQLGAVLGAGRESARIVDLDQTRVGRLSRMDALQSQAISQETNRRRDLQLLKISSALTRIEEGDFGNCMECGEEISVKRLEIDPVAMFCIRCATELEQR